MKMLTKVRMCNRPDAVCLEGGCGYCSTNSKKDAKWWPVGTLRTYADEHGLRPAFEYGYGHRWPNREKKYREVEG